MIPARPTAITNATRTIPPAPIESYSESKLRKRRPLRQPRGRRSRPSRGDVVDTRHPVEAHTFVPEQRDALNLPPPTMNTDAVSGTFRCTDTRPPARRSRGELFQHLLGHDVLGHTGGGQGATALLLMLYLAPSWASVLISPTNPSFAAP